MANMEDDEDDEGEGARRTTAKKMGQRANRNLRCPRGGSQLLSI